MAHRSAASGVDFAGLVFEEPAIEAELSHEAEVRQEAEARPR
ncbi:MAG TPA: hypothetical protein VFJ07_22950 [Streptosporangiaceae bacterium]|nr:hypothetical protein [Streptosporangiaceae bacterium]